MKTPIAYYGGKQSMLRHILPRIPKHTVYTEPFFGGGAVFFAKPPSKAEIINDNNHMLINFFEVVKTNFTELKKKVEATLFSRAIYTVALAMYRAPHLFGPVQKAWAFFVATQMGFASGIGSWGYDKFGKRSKTFLNKALKFDESIAQRLGHTTVECKDACSVIKTYDSKEAFHYIDPPYIDTNLGHYRGYTQDNYQQLLETLSAVKGKFLLSSFPSALLSKYVNQNGWHTISFKKPLCAHKSKDGSSKPIKIEMLTANYPLEG